MLNDIGALGVAAAIVVVLATILGVGDRIRRTLGRDVTGPGGMMS